MYITQLNVTLSLEPGLVILVMFTLSAKFKGAWHCGPDRFIPLVLGSTTLVPTAHERATDKDTRSR